jgi:hypothetical protein
MSDNLRIADAPLMPQAELTEDVKIPTGGKGNFSVNPDMIAEYTVESKDLADKNFVNSSSNGVRQLLEQHIEDESNPHNVTKQQVGLGNVDNTSDLNKPISNATQAALNSKADSNNVVNSVNGQKGAVTVSRDSLGIPTDQQIKEFEKEARFVITESDQTQQEINDFGGYAQYKDGRIYEKNQYVMLDNGDVVKAINDGVMSNPNVDMTGWISREYAIDKKLSRTVWVNDYGDVGSGQDATQAFRDAVADAGVGGIVMFDGSGTYMLSEPTNILDKQEINGNGAKLINNFDRTAYPRGTVQGLIQYGYNSVGNPTNLTTIGTTTSDFGLFNTTISLGNTSSLNIGDMVSVANYSGFVIDKNETSITLDRFSTYLIPSGSTLYKVNYYSDIFIHDFEIDFNGSTELPRYGFGVLGHGGFNCRDENIKASNIGSKVVDYRRCISNKAKNISVFYGTDNFDDGGHGYAVRFGGGCDNCIAEQVIGTKVRHTVDLAGAQRCKVLNSEASHNDFAAFLTHASQTHFNEFIDNNVLESGACYETRVGDTYNIIKGGKTFGRLFIDNTNVGGTTKVSGVDITNPSGVNPIQPLTFENCKINLLTGQTASFIRFTGTTARTVMFNSCDFTVNTTLNNSLVSSTGTGACIVIFNNCKFNIESSSALTTMGANDKLIFNDCELFSIDQTVNLPIFASSGEIEVNGGSFAFKNTGVSFFGLSAATSKLSIYNNAKIVNASNVFRRYATGSILNLGETIMFNSSYLALSNLNVNSIGVANNVPYPPLGSWSEGSKIINPAPANEGFIGYVYIASNWKGYGQIQS